MKSFRTFLHFCLQSFTQFLSIFYLQTQWYDFLTKTLITPTSGLWGRGGWWRRPRRHHRYARFPSARTGIWRCGTTEGQLSPSHHLQFVLLSEFILPVFLLLVELLDYLQEFRNKRSKYLLWSHIGCTVVLMYLGYLLYLDWMRYCKYRDIYDYDKYWHGTNK